MRSNKSGMFWKAITHEIIQVLLNYIGRQKVMLCTYTGIIHEDGDNDDDHQHNSAVHSIKEMPTTSYQAKY
jgi:hypothetical protein